MFARTFTLDVTSGTARAALRAAAFLVVALVLTWSAQSADATLIATQSQLDSALGSSQAIENFSAIHYEGDMTTPPDTWGVTVGPSLNSSTIIPQIGPFTTSNPTATTNDFNNPFTQCVATLDGPCGREVEPAQGPGLVKPGLNFVAGPGTRSDFPPHIRYFPIGASVPAPGIQEIGTDTLEIDFSTLVKAVGLTLASLGEEGGPAELIYTISIFDKGDNLLTQEEVNGLFGVGFLGDIERRPIGKIILQSNDPIFAPVLSELTFAPLIEPPGLALFGGMFTICGLLVSWRLRASRRTRSTRGKNGRSKVH